MTDRQIHRRSLLVSAAAAVCAGCTASATVSIEDSDIPTVAEATAVAQAEAAVGYGAWINFGPLVDVVQEIRDNDGFLYKPEGRLWLVEYPAAALDQARDQYSRSELAGMEAGIVALLQKCPHLGCRVPSCATSQWFECPCHGSKYNRVGEHRGGPAPRGMDRHVVEISDQGDLNVNTGHLIQGPPIGTNTTGQEAEGEFCIGEVDS